MEINERKEKINLLQMKSKRNTIIKEMKIKDIHLTLDSFLEPQHSYDLLGDLFNKIDKPVDYKEEFKFGHCKDKAAKELGLLYKKIPKHKGIPIFKPFNTNSINKGRFNNNKIKSTV